MHLMGLPHDFEILEPGQTTFANYSSREKTILMISQNVPVTTARDMAEDVKRFCRGQLELSDAIFLKQDNTVQLAEKMVSTKSNTPEELPMGYTGGFIYNEPPTSSTPKPAHQDISSFFTPVAQERELKVPVPFKPEPMMNVSESSVQ